MTGERTKSAFLLASPPLRPLPLAFRTIDRRDFLRREDRPSFPWARHPLLLVPCLALPEGRGLEEGLLLLPLLVFVFEAATLIALLLEAGFSYGVRIDGGFFLVGKGIRLVGTGQAVPYPGGEGWMYGKDLYSYPFRFDVPIAFLILLVLLVLYRKETKGWALRFLRMDGGAPGARAHPSLRPRLHVPPPRGLPSPHGGISPGSLPGVPPGGPPLLPCPLEGTGGAIPHRPRPRLPRGTYEAGVIHPFFPGRLIPTYMALDPFRGSGIATSARGTYPSPSSPIPGS